MKYPSNGHDPCIANLPGITDACCGHGKEGYLGFENGIVIRGKFAIERWSSKPFKIEELRKGKGWKKKKSTVKLKIDKKGDVLTTSIKRK